MGRQPGAAGGPSNIERLEKALAKYQDEAKEHYIKGIALHKEGKLAEAIAEYDKAVLLYPRCPEVHYNRGLAYRRNGDLEQAAVDYTQAIELDPKFTAAYSNRGYVNFKLGDLAGALADFHKVLELDPQNADALKSIEVIEKIAETRRFAMKWFRSRSLGILVAAVPGLAGGCSRPAAERRTPAVARAQRQAQQARQATKTVGRQDRRDQPRAKPTEPGDGKKPSDAKPAETKPAPSKPAVDEKKMSVTKEAYGKLPDGTQIDQYTLCNPNGLKVKIINYGAIITAVETPDRNGKIENITLYRDSLADYMEVKDGKPTTPYFGATVGRYGNRIAKGRFTLDGKEYTAGHQQRAQCPARRTEGFRQGRLEGRAGRVARHGRRGFHLHQPRRRRRLSRHAQGQGHLQPDRQGRAEDGLRGHDRQDHGPQSHEPYLLEPRRGRQRRRPQARIDAQRRSVPARRQHVDPAGASRSGQGHGHGLHRAEDDRQGHRPGRRRLRSLLRPVAQGRRLEPGRAGCRSRPAAA